jgi:hypothetical protein
MDDGSVGVVSEKPQPKVLICATTWWPLSARLAMAFLRHGCRVSAICPPGHPLRFVTGIDSVDLYLGLDSLGSLKGSILATEPTFIVPCDDGVVWQLHALHAQEQALRSLIEGSLGSKDSYPVIRSRLAYLQAAAEIGVRVPVTKAVASEADVIEEWAGPAAVLKLNGTWGGSGVAIVRSQLEALAAFRKLSQPMGAGVAWKRWLINRDPIAVWTWRRQEVPTVTMQEFIQGRPANTMIACWEGEVLSIVSVEVLTSQGTTGAATTVRLIRNDEIEQAARRLARRFKLNGFQGLDFVLEQTTGAAYLIEINPRCTQLGHLRLPEQGDLAGAISAKIGNKPMQAAKTKPKECLRGDTVAFFPQAFKWNPRSPYLRSGNHDVPWEEPALLRELLREAWPERQWLSRIYHRFHAPKHQDEVNFEE